MQKVNVVLDEQQQTEVRMILVDQDEKEALIFLKEVVWEQIQAANNKALRGHMEQGAA